MDYSNFLNLALNMMLYLLPPPAFTYFDKNY